MSPPTNITATTSSTSGIIHQPNLLPAHRRRDLRPVRLVDVPVIEPRQAHLDPPELQLVVLVLAHDRRK
jgi:hypothetical protein